MDVINDQFVSASQSLLAEALAFLGDVVSEPLLEDGKFRSSYVESEKETLRNRLQAIVNDKIRYSAERCVEEMCKNEPYRLQALGRLDDIAGISPEALYQNYSAWLDHAAFDLYVAGDTTLEEVAELAGKAFKLKPRQPGTYGAPDKGYSIKETNYVVEEMDVNQGKLNMGLRTGITYGDDAYAAMLMYNGILGGYPHSKLFRNVREKESLAYYASSRLDGHKGICAIQSGIEFQNYDKALEIITEQLASMSKGELSDLEMNQTKAMIMGHLREIQDSAYEMIAYDFNGVLSGNLRTRDELMAQIAAITPEDVAEVGKHVRLETVYFLRNRKEA
jgi:predicted Zn-dependent peptidase